VLDLDLGAHLLEGSQVEVDRTVSDGAAAGQRDPGAPFARQHRTQHEDGRAHGLDEVVGGLDRREPGRLQLHDAADADVGLHAHGREHAPHRADVAHLGHVAEDDGLVGQDRGAHVRQGGVLRPRDADRALQGLATDDADLFHLLPV
jgi:hypothetical protein